MKSIHAMTNTELNNRIRELSNILDGNPMGKTWDEAYSEYCKLTAEQDELFRAREPKFFQCFLRGAYQRKDLGGNRQGNLGILF